jgi:hypothetical protein
MAEPDHSPIHQVKEDLARLGDGLQKMAGLRWDLVRLEWDAATAQLRRLAIVLTAAGGAVVISLALLAVVAAELWEGYLGISRAGWLAIFAAGLMIAAIAVTLVARRYFRRQFVGMQETLEEFREDAVWIKEWLGKSDE